MQVLVSHFTGNPNSCAVAQALAEDGALAAFHTTLVVPGWLRCLTGTGTRRTFPEVVEPHMKSHAWRELLRLACRSSPALRRLPLAAKLGALDRVVRWFDGEVSRGVRRSGGVQAVYAYMDAAEQTFLAAKERGMKTFYELPTPYWRFTRDVVKEEAGLMPDWAATLPVLEEGSDAMLRRDRELQLADVVVVPSELVRDSLKLAPSFKAKVHVVPYGCPETGALPSPVGRTKGRLRVLYVGSLNQGKGLAYLAEAMFGLEGVAELTVIGSRTADKPCEALDAFLAAHRHRSGLSHAEVLAEMRQHDVLVLPTLYEGLALVLLEAMACGMAVVTTPHSGLEGLIQDGQEGFVVPVRSAEAIRDRLKLLAADEMMLQSMRSAALSWSRKHSWQRFREEIRQVVRGG